MNMDIELFCGDICSAPVEVICTSTNPHLDLMLGTGGTVRERGGWSIQEQCSAIIAAERAAGGAGYLKPGSAVMTGAGALPYRGIIHCVAIDAFHDSTEQVVASCVRGAIGLCEAMQPPAASIGLPVFASGNGRLNFDRSLRAMLQALRVCDCPQATRALIVIHREDKLARARAILDSN